MCAFCRLITSHDSEKGTVMNSPARTRYVVGDFPFRIVDIVATRLSFHASCCIDGES